MTSALVEQRSIMQLISFRALAIGSALLVVTVVPALMSGAITNRWGPSEDLQLATARLDACPKLVGDWKQVSDLEMTPSAVRELRVAGYLRGEYLNQKTGKQLYVLLLVGMPGALSRHPPELCYAGQNARIGAPANVTVTSADQRQHTFRLLKYRQYGSVGDEFSVCYGFSSDGAWSSPEYPRIEFGGKSILYKMQVRCEGALPEGGGVPDEVAEFLGLFLPILSGKVIQSGPTG
jgi:hypothetical protein